MALDADDLKKIGEMLTEAVGKQVGDTLKSQIAALGLDKLGDTVKALGADVVALKVKPEDAADDKGKGKQDSKADPATQALQAQLKTLTDNLAAEKRRGAESARDTAIREALAANGITDPTRIKAALPVILANLTHEIGDDGALKWKVEQNGVPNVPVDTATAIKSFVGTDIGKMFVAATGIEGSGDKGGRRTPPVQASENAPKTAAEFLSGLGV